MTRSHEQFELQQSAHTAIKGAIAGAECGASEGPGCAKMAKFLVTKVPREVFATLELARIITNTGTSETEQSSFFSMPPRLR